MTRPLVPAGLVAAACVVLSGATPVVFTDVTELSGIRFIHTTGAFGEKYMPETFGSGVLWLDIDEDGRQDILFVNGTAWPERPEAATHAALYRKRRRRHVHRHHTRLRSRRPAVWHGRHRRRLRQRRTCRYLSDRPRPQPALQGTRRRHLRRRDGRGPGRRPRLVDRGALVRLRQGRASGPVRRELCGVGPPTSICSARSTTRSPIASPSRIRDKARRSIATGAIRPSKT